MNPPKITLYVDIVSPFAYIAFYVLNHSPVFKQCEVTYVPILLGGLMNACGNTPPLQITNKNTWINTERQRWAEKFNVPILQDPPPGFPINTLSIQRTLVSLSCTHPQLVESAISLFWENYWVQYNEPTKLENLHAVIKTVVGNDEEAQKIVAGSKSEEVKKMLIDNTNQAFKDGAFGLPWFVATNPEGETETYWGVDRLGQMCDHLGFERPAAKGWRCLL